MIALLKKDWRANRSIVLGSLAMIAMPYVIVLVGDALQRSSPKTARYMVQDFMAAAAGSMWLITLIAPIFGAAAFAQERRERSADFVAMLPITRRQIVLSKFITIVSWLAVTWLANLAVLMLARWLAPEASKSLSDLVETLVLSLAFGTMLFGVSWLLSAFLNSPAVAAGGAIGAMVGLWFCLVLIIAHAEPHGGDADDLLIGAGGVFGVLIGLAAFIGGSVYYVHRIEP